MVKFPSAWRKTSPEAYIMPMPRRENMPSRAMRRRKRVVLKGERSMLRVLYFIELFVLGMVFLFSFLIFGFWYTGNGRTEFAPTVLAGFRDSNLRASMCVGANSVRPQPVHPNQSITPSPQSKYMTAESPSRQKHPNPHYQSHSHIHST